MIAVSNTSPLIVLSKTGYIKHLRKLFRRIWIPRSVKLEIFRKNDQTRAKIEKLIKQEFIEIKMIKNTSLAHILNMELGIGESEAIVLGMETKSDYVLLDDLKARLYARSFRINVTGTLGIVIALVKKEIIKEKPDKIYKSLKSADFWISKELFFKAFDYP